MLRNFVRLAQLFDARCHFITWQSQFLRDEQDVLARGQVRKQVAALDDVAHSTAKLRKACRGEFFSIDLNPAGGRFD